MTLPELLKQRDRLIEYLKLKTDMQDWHGVADAAMDLREIDAKIETYKGLAGV